MLNARGHAVDRAFVDFAEQFPAEFFAHVGIKPNEANNAQLGLWIYETGRFKEFKASLPVVDVTWSSQA